MQRCRPALVLMLLIVLCLSNLGATRIPARLMVSIAESSNDPELDTLVWDAVYYALSDALSWRLALNPENGSEFKVKIHALNTSRTLFPGQQYLSFSLDLAWDGNDLSRQFAILGANLASLGKTAKATVKDQLRYDLLSLIEAPEESVVLHYVHGSSLSLVGSNDFQLGVKVLITDFDGQEIATAKVTDIIDPIGQQKQTVVELRQISAKAKPEPGMLVVEKPMQWDVMVSLPFSLEGFGVEAEMTFPMRSSSRYFSLKGGGWAAYTSFGGTYDIELLARAGVGANFGISSPNVQPRSLFSDISLGFACRIGMGFQFTQSGTADFLYGTEVELTINKHLSSRMSWGLTAGYRYWVFPKAGNFQTIHANEQGLLIAPFIGMSW